MAIVRFVQAMHFPLSLLLLALTTFTCAAATAGASCPAQEQNTPFITLNAPVIAANTKILQLAALPSGAVSFRSVPIGASGDPDYNRLVESNVLPLPARSTGKPQFSPLVTAGKPVARYPSNIAARPYADFAEQQRDRSEHAYAVGSDGVLHVFGATAGQRALSFDLAAMASDNKEVGSESSSFRVSQLSIGDAFVRGSWRTVLLLVVSGDSARMYALDVTDSRLLSEQAKDSILWSLSSRDDPSLSSISRPSIGKLHSGVWAAVFGNGEPSARDNPIEQSSDPTLFVVDIETGKLIRKITVATAEEPRESSESGGLSTPALTDVDGDRIAEYAYAGDRKGNLWKFDLRAAKPSEWNVAFGGEPLFTAESSHGALQSINTRPEVVRNPRSRGTIVVFGAIAAISHAGSGSVYGVFDDGVSRLIKRNALLQQEIEYEVAFGTGQPAISGRRTSYNQLSMQRGWVLDLSMPAITGVAEVPSDPVLHDGRVYFTSLAHRVAPGACQSPVGWLVALNSSDGTRVDEGMQSERSFGAKGEDELLNGISYPAEPSLWPLPPLIVEDSKSTRSCKQHLYAAGATNQLLHVSIKCHLDLVGRQSWRQLR